MDSDIITGQKTVWTLIKKLGEGDAGEVYQVESLLGQQKAILKRPRRSPFPADCMRQSAQIAIEARILTALANASLPAGAPELLDQSKPGTQGSERFFIVIEEARGFDFSFLLRAGKLGLADQPELLALLAPEERVFLEAIIKTGQVPTRAILQALSDLLATLDKIHTLRSPSNGGETWGIIWNDVKPEHLFWDPRRAHLTIIDWGNAQFLEADGTTPDRQHSWADDYRQLYDEMGRFLELASPGLAARLDWPLALTPENATAEALAALAERLTFALQQENQSLADTRLQEETLLRNPTAGASRNGPEGESPLEQLGALWQAILACGEIPDYAGGQRLAGSQATLLAMQDDLPGLRTVCAWARQAPGAPDARWEIIDRLAQIPGRSEGEMRRSFLAAIQAAVCADWESVLWNLVAALQDFPEPEWWPDLVGVIRRQAGNGADGLRPLVAASRFLYTLQDTVRRLENNPSAVIGNGPDGTPAQGPVSIECIQSVARRLREDILTTWVQTAPEPPHAGLAYTDLEALLGELGEALVEERRLLMSALNTPRLQVRRVLEAWERKEFLAASQALRPLLLYDPDRRRLLRAEKTILSAPDWLNRVHQGPQKEANLQEVVTALEFEGREMRNLVGPACWLDDILEGFKKLRRGAWPGDLLIEVPSLASELPWLRHYERLERLPALAVNGAEPPLPAPAPHLAGVAEGRLCPDQEMVLVEPLDTWAPEARGSSARVFSGLLRSADGRLLPAAVKLMRMDQIDYALPLFYEEVQVLSIMKDIPGVNPLLECGFIYFDDGVQMPPDQVTRSAGGLSGDLIRIGPDSPQIFLEQLDSRVNLHWIPYLALKKRHHQDNLLGLCDAGMTHGQYPPVGELLQMAIQICDILQAAHDRKIVYRDHKILHYYWEVAANGIYIIDWNVARYHPQELPEVERQMDLVQFAARGLHHILTGRAAPGALPLGPTRPEEIERAAKTYQTQWTYDDQRLPETLRQTLERALAGEYSRPVDLRNDLKHAFAHLTGARGP